MCSGHQLNRRAGRAGSVLHCRSKVIVSQHNGPGLQEYNTEAAFSASVLLSTLALATLGVKEIIEQRAGAETKK